MESLERAIAEAGIHYPRSYDIAYRIGYPIQLLGILYFTFAFIFALPYTIAGIFVFESGVVLSSIFLLVWKKEIKRFILMAIFAGIILQVLSYAILPEPYLRTLFIISVGLVCVGGAGLAGKEAYCFGFYEGWLIMLLYPLIIFTNLIGADRVILAILYISLLLLYVSFLRKKLSQPLLRSCETNVCGTPEKNVMGIFTGGKGGVNFPLPLRESGPSKSLRLFG